jgi:hypothetical protein
LVRLFRSALFESYDEDFKALLASLKGKLEGDVKQLKGGASSADGSSLITSGLS